MSAKRLEKVRIGVVGGSFGCAFQWHLHPQCIVQAVAEIRPERRERLVKTYSPAKAYESLEEMIQDPKLDAVMVATGAPDHARHCAAALRAGKHVISAVPAATSLDDCRELLAAVQETGLTYMMAETSYYRQSAISARRFYQEGQFGEIYFTETEYLHAGLEGLWFEGGQPTWRHGLPPMLYPTHCTAYVTGITGERLTEVSCIGWGDDDPLLKGNAYNNPFWNETALFQTDRGHAVRVAVYWKGAHRGGERAQWYGDKMSFFMALPNGLGPIIVRSGRLTETDDAGFVREAAQLEQYDQPQWWKTDLLPEPLRGGSSGHDGSHPFLTHEFIDAIVNGRRPAIDIYEALAYTVPGIIAHESALQGGKRMPVPSFDPAP